MRSVAPINKRQQQGVVFYLFVVLTLIALASLTIGVGKRLSSQQDIRDNRQAALIHARDLVLAQLAQPELFAAGARLGQFSVLPDLTANASAGTEASEPNYDGLGETAGCAYRTWAIGQPLQQPATSGAAARCFGRLAWQSVGFTGSGHDANDVAGDLPWLIISPNLVANATCLPNLTPHMLGQPFVAYGCPAHQPYPWLRVVDARGNLLSDRVAFALVIPGGPVAGQTRTATAPISAYLDSITVLPGCQAPCQPGTYDNAGYTHADGDTWTLIHAPSSGPLVNRESTYAAPVEFNDQLIWVTVDELFRYLENRARQHIVTALGNFRTTYGHYPYAAPVGSPTTDCANGTRLGHPPTADGTCGSGNSLTLPGWLTAAGWQRYFIYAVSARCVASNPACIAPGLTVDASNDINALLFTPGQPLTVAPYAASRAGPQQPLTGSSTLSTNPADWLDLPENAAGLPDVFQFPSKTASNENDTLHSFY